MSLENFYTNLKDRIATHEFKPIVLKNTAKKIGDRRRSKRYRESHLEYCKQKALKWDREHPEQRRERGRRWRELHKNEPGFMEKERERNRKRRQKEKANALFLLLTN